MDTHTDTQTDRSEDLIGTLTNDLLGMPDAEALDAIAQLQKALDDLAALLQRPSQSESLFD